MCARYYDMSVRTVRTATEEFPRHSEASIIELRDGSLLMAWQRHEKSRFGSGDEAPASICFANSYDEGKTWINERKGPDMTDGCVNVYSPSFLRNLDGSISLYFRRYMEISFTEPHVINYYKITSFDEGKTFSDEELLWENKPYGAMNHAAKRLSDGAMLLPIEESKTGFRPNNKTRDFVSVIRSEDDFKTTSVSEAMTVPLRGLMEPCIAERSDGVLNMVLRTQLGSVFYSESYDGGRSWTKPQTTGLCAPESCPCIVSVPNSDAQLVIWNNAEYDMSWRSHYGKRTPLTMAISRDGLKTFTDFYDIETDPDCAFTNPAVTVTSTGLFLLNYWACEYTPEGLFGPLIDLKLATFRIEL